MRGLFVPAPNAWALQEGVNSQRHLEKHLGQWPITQPSESRQLSLQRETTPWEAALEELIVSPS